MHTNSTPPGPINRLSLGTHARIEVEGPDGITVAVEGTVFAVDVERVAIRFRDLDAPLTPRMPLDANVVLRVWDKYGMHRAETVVHAIIEDGGNGAVILGSPARFVGTQTRRFFRVSARLEVTLERPASDSWPARSERTLSCDISAGGLSFLSDSVFAIDDRVSVSMVLPQELVGVAGEDLRKLDARIVRSETVADTTRRFFGVEFQNVTNRRRDRLIETMLGLQRIVR